MHESSTLGVSAPLSSAPLSLPSGGEIWVPSRMTKIENEIVQKVEIKIEIKSLPKFERFMKYPQKKDPQHIGS